MSHILEQLRAGISTRTPEATQKIAADFARTLSGNTTLALHGTLGVGKTTFVQGLARALGITTHVTSPTFTIFTIHKTAPANSTGIGSLKQPGANVTQASKPAPSPSQITGQLPPTPGAAAPSACSLPATRYPQLDDGSAVALIHLDAYRLANSTQLDPLMLEDFLTPPYILAVEWPENIADWLPKETLHLHLSILPDTSHHIQLRPAP